MGSGSSCFFALPFFSSCRPASLKSPSPHYTTTVNLQGGPLLLARFFLRQGLSPDGRDYRLGDPRAGGGSKARPAVFAGDASWNGRDGGAHRKGLQPQ